MNYIRHLSGFFARVASENRLNPTHISLYMGLFQYWNLNRFVNPISISRSDMMSVSKICSKATYHKVMKDLHQLGFIKYEPSYNPFRGSAVTLINLEEEEVQKRNSRHTKNQTSSELAIGRYHTKKQESTVLLNEPYINNTNIINSKHCKQHKQNETNDTSSNFDGANAQEKKPVLRSFSEGGEKSTPGGAVFFENKIGKETRVRTKVNQQRTTKTLPLPKSLEEVKAFFTAQKSASNEAEKFYNYFQSNGWKVGGRAPMKNWQAAARNWLLNSHKFETKKPSLHASILKDYGEPL
ncbi:MAG: transcriptional regulator [Cyclobacteriaceae bacterium]|nr:transcriptional regulator [Cyclobacteriaceae bacterium]